MLIVKVVSGLAFLAALAWSVAKQDLESLSAVLGSLAVLIGSFYVDRKSKSGQVQEVGSGGIGVQAGGNVQVGSIQSKMEDKTDAR